MVSSFTKEFSMSGFYPIEDEQSNDPHIRAGYVKACKDIDAMSDEFLTTVWESIGENCVNELGRHNHLRI
jgi:hypothetical protein